MTQPKLMPIQKTIEEEKPSVRVEPRITVNQQDFEYDYEQEQDKGPRNQPSKLLNIFDKYHTSSQSSLPLQSDVQTIQFQSNMGRLSRNRLLPDRALTMAGGVENSLTKSRMSHLRCIKYSMKDRPKKLNMRILNADKSKRSPRFFPQLYTE